MAKKKADISKQVWKFQEGLVYLALREICKNPESVHWNYEKVSGNSKKKYTPTGMSIDPDIVIGSNHNKPEILVFVTHATMERGSEKKFWRTVAEIIEEKALDSHPKVCSVLFAGNVKANIMTAYETLFDGTYHLDLSSEGEKISRDLVELTKVYGECNPDDCVTILKQYIEGYKDLWANFVEKTKEMVVSGYGPKHKSLVSVTDTKKSRVPNARNTALRRAINKIITLPEPVREAIFQGKEYVLDVPKHAIMFGWFSPIATTGKKKYRLSDTDISTVVSEMETDSLRYLVRSALSLPALCQYIDSLNKINARSSYNDWIIDNYEKLCAQKGMLDSLDEVFLDNQKPVENYLPSEECLSTHWLFEGIMALLRAETGHADGYGYSALGIEAGHEYEIGGLAGVIISPYIKRTKNLKPELITDIARVFASHLKRIGKDNARALLNDSILGMSHSLFKYTIGTYRLMNPIDWLLKEALEKKKIPFAYHVKHPSFLSDDLSGLTTSTGNMISLLNGNVWIKCQSAYDGATDKRKELCGRVGAMKLLHSPEELRDKRFFLVIDGEFDAEDIRLLDSAGWDGIYYYDEVEILISDIRELKF